jgi:HSP90 family molecular chaperone
LVKKYSEFIQYPIKLFLSKEVRKQVDEEEEEKDIDKEEEEDVEIREEDE